MIDDFLKPKFNNAFHAIDLNDREAFF